MKRLIAFALSTLGLVSTAHALGLERPELGMKETLGVCPSKQDQTTCSLLDLKGRVKHVVLKNYDTKEEFYFDQKGALTKRVHPRGGTFERTYDARGRLVSEKVGSGATQYEYGAKFLARQVGPFGSPLSFDIRATAEGGRKLKVTAPSGKQADVEFDGKGRIVSGSEDYARVYEINPEGPFHCDYVDLPDGGIRSTCKGPSELGVEYGPDRRLRVLQLGPSHRYTFTYPESDAKGNWLVRKDNTGQKLVRQVEYWD